MKGTKETIDEYLEGFKARSIGELPGEVLAGLMDDIVQPMYGGAYTIYEESDDEEREKLVADIVKCLEGNASISYHLVVKEGVLTEKNEGYFDFCDRHSVWYDITER